MKPNQHFLWLLAFLCCTLAQTSFAQAVWTEPFFPRPNQPITVYFDATQGTGGLKDCGCTVYVHTGVITNSSTSTSDWKNVFTTWGASQCRLGHERRSRSTQCVQVRNQAQHQRVLQNHVWHCAKNGLRIPQCSGFARFAGAILGAGQVGSQTSFVQNRPESAATAYEYGSRAWGRFGAFCSIEGNGSGMGVCAGFGGGVG